MTGLGLGLAVVAGVLLGAVAALPPPFLVALALMAIVVGGLWWRWPLPRLASLALLALLVGMLRWQLTPPPTGERAISSYQGKGLVRVRGEVAEEPQLRDQTVDLHLEARQLWLGEQERPVEGGVLVRLARPFEVRYGDAVEVIGELQSPPSFHGRFDYPQYLARQGIYSYLAYPRVVAVAPADPSNLRGALFRLKEHLSDVLARSLPQPEGALAQGILLGVRSSFPPDLTVALAATGTTHLVAISGFNVTLVAGLALLLGRRWRLEVSTLLALGSIGLFALLVGPQPSVVRAALMGGLVVMANHFGRPSDAATGLSLAAAAMALHNPHVLWDVAFQLSILSTAGLIGLAPAFAGWLAKVPGILRQNLAVTLAAQVATLPIVALNFGTISLASLPVNLLALPLVGPAMLFSCLAALAGSLWTPLASPFAWLAYLPLAAMTRAIAAGASLPTAVLQPGPLPVGLPWLYYVALGLVLTQRTMRPFSHDQPALLLGHLPFVPTLVALAVAAALVWLAWWQAPDGRLHLVFLDVGQGDAVLVQAPAGQQILIDGGPSPSAIDDGLGKELPFWDRSLDMIVLTHPDDDHLVGLLEVLQRYDVQQALEPGCVETSPSYVRWQQLLRERQVKRVLAHAGQEIPLGQGMRLRVLSPLNLPSKGACGEDVNDYSVVLRLESTGFSALLTGDLTADGQPALLRSGASLASQVLKVPHHGAREALSEAFLERTAPQTAIISVGLGNRYGHPAPETLARLQDRGVQVYRTDRDGTVEVVVEAGGRYEVVVGRR